MKQTLAQRADNQSQEVVMQAGGHKGRGMLEAAPCVGQSWGLTQKQAGPKPAAAPTWGQKAQGANRHCLPPGAFLSCSFRQWCRALVELDTEAGGCGK